MPGRRRGSARGSLQRTAKPDDPPMRTRYGRGAKSAPTKGESSSRLKTSPNHSNGHLTARDRASSDLSNATSPWGTHASFKSPLLIIHGLSSKFLGALAEKEQRSQRKERLWIGEFTQSDLDNDTSSDATDVPTPPPATPARGRGRGRGGRGRGRGGGRGRGRGASMTQSLQRDISPVRTRKTRHAAPTFPLTEEDDEDSANHSSAFGDAKDDHHAHEEDEVMTDAPDDINTEETERRSRIQASTTPPGSSAMGQGVNASETKSKAVPTIALPQDPATQTPPSGISTAAASPAPQYLKPEDDILSDSDLPGPWVENYVRPTSEAECDDKADYLLKTRFKPMTDVEHIISALTKFAPSQRSTENLYRLAENTQKVLRAWQDEYLHLDARTAPHAHPPKKPANGGRIPVAPQVFEDMKEADLYGYVYDPKKLPGTQDPFAQRIGAEKSGGRALRQRRTRDMLDSAAQSEVEEEGENGGRAVGQRQRRATRRFDVAEQPTGTSTPKKNNGWGGARKRGVSKYAQGASETPEPESRSAKRAKLGGTSLIHHRIREMREESAVTSSGEEGSTQDASDTQRQGEEFRKRGRPAGSKNTGRRSDYGIKKGPRKKPVEAPTPSTVAQPASIPPPVLQSLSEGQNQFSIDPHPPTASQHGMHSSAPQPPMLAPQPASTVFQANPQPPSIPDTGVHPPPTGELSPDAYMNTTPLSQYSHPYSEDASLSPASGSKRKPRVKSEKRSQSMTIWWAERKARQKELEDKAGVSKPVSSKSSTPKPSAIGGSSVSYPSRHEQTHGARPDPKETVAQEIYPTPPTHRNHLPLPSPNMEYSQAAPLLPPPSQMLLQNSPLAALPSGPAAVGPRSSMPALAPAPMPPQLQNYPSPYGPRTAPRPKSSAPPPLAPAPAHVSPYPPTMGHGPAMPRESNEMPFMMIVPAPPPEHENDRRG